MSKSEEKNKKEKTRGRVARKAEKDKRKRAGKKTVLYDSGRATDMHTPAEKHISADADAATDGNAPVDGHISVGAESSMRDNNSVLDNTSMTENNAIRDNNSMTENNSTHDSASTVVDERNFSDGKSSLHGNAEVKPRRVRNFVPDSAKIPFTQTVFRTDGLNRARLLTRLAEVATLKVLRSDSEELRFSVSSADKSKVVAILNSLCYDYIIIKEEGPFFSLLSCLRRAGIVAGIVCSVAALAVYPHLVTSVEATGEWNDDVSRILTENGISIGKLVWEFDSDEVERQLLELDGVAFASVSKRGTRVYVDVRTELDGEDFVDIGTQPVKATVRATVTRTVVFSGSALVEYGDVVNVGDELIGAYVTVGEEKVACPADGEVYGKTYRTYTKFFPDTENVAVRGRTKSYTRLSFFGKVPSAPASPFADYVLETSVWRNDFLLGYTKYTFTFHELTFVERQNTRTDDQMSAETYSELVATMPAGVNVLNRSFQVRKENGGTYVTVTVEAEERIDNRAL